MRSILFSLFVIILLTAACSKEKAAYPERFYFSSFSIARIPLPDNPDVEATWNGVPVLELLNTSPALQKTQVPQGDTQHLQIREKGNGRLWLDTTLNMPASGLSYMYLLDTALHISILTHPLVDSMPAPEDGNSEVISYLNAFPTGSGKVDIIFFKTTDFATLEPFDTIKGLSFGQFSPYRKFITQETDDQGNLIQYYYLGRVTDAVTGVEYLSEWDLSDRMLGVFPSGSTTPNPKLKYILFDQGVGLAVQRLEL